MTWFPLLISVVLAATGGEVSPDPWNGKGKDEIIALLGDPPKRKRLADGGERWTYKLVRLADDAEVPPGMTIFPLPGYGLLGRMLDTGRETVEMAPSEIDEDGRPVAGSMKTTQRREISWSKEDGRVEKDTAVIGPALKGKVKLSLDIDAAGKIRSWTVR